MPYPSRLFALTPALMVVMAFGTTARHATAQADYYKVTPVYIPYPQPDKKWSMRRAGPTGLSLELMPPRFTMRITEIAKGSPAEATGKLKKGQIIETINGRKPKDIDPRVYLANLFGEAEATDGIVKLKIRGEGEVVIKLPVLGRYSDTWPIDCPKSDKIVRNLADTLAKQESPGWGSVLFLLSTGEEKDLEVVKRWMKEYKGENHYPWHIGMKGIGVCEYYLRTGDQSILPVIKGMTEQLKEQVYAGGWSGRGKASFTYMAGGQLSAAGVPCLTFLLLARQCGVDVDEHTLQSSLEHFYKFAGHANVAYGDQLPEGGYRDNGKTAVLALAMAAAAQLTDNPEASVYAAARDNSAMKSFYASSWFNRAHTGGGIGEMWHANAMQLMREKRPTQWRSFMDERRWHFELSRRHDGSIGIHDCTGYDASATEHSRSWGTIHALVYTAHRKNLRIFGAPPSRWSTKHKLPERPWGNEADDAYHSLIAAEHAPGKRADYTGETIIDDASAPLMRRLGEADEATLWQYLHHPEYGVRHATMRIVLRKNLDGLVLRALQSDDPRLRGVGAEALGKIFKGRPLPDDRITDEMWDLIGQMIDDPNEAWWNAHCAMNALARAKPERIAQHLDRLLHFLENDSWWMHTAAMQPLPKIVADDRYYKRILPAVAAIVKKEFAYQSSAPAKNIVAALKNASPAAKRMGLELFGEAYVELPDPIVAPGGQITPNQTEVLRGRALGFLRSIDGSQQFLEELPKLTAKWQITRREADKYRYTGRFTPNRQVMGNWKVVDIVGAIDDFKYDKARNIKGAAFRTITFKDRGKTDNPMRAWTGSTLIDFGRNVAVEMKFKDVEVPPTGPIRPQKQDDILLDPDAKDPNAVFKSFLFIEAGTFGGSKPRDYKSPYYVLEKTN